MVKSRHLRNVRGFFSDYYLGSALGIGAGRGRRRIHTDRETDFAFFRFLRVRERAEGKAADAASCREKFLRPFLRDILGYHLGAGEDRVHGLYVSAEAEERRDKPLLVAYCGAWDEDLDAGRGASNPRHKTEMAIVWSSLRYGLLLSGERIRLIRAPGEGPRGSYLEADLEGMAEDEEPESFPFLLRFFSAATFTPDPEGKTLIDEIEHASRDQAQKVSDDLKRAVFTAAESLVAGFIEDAVASGRIGSPLELQEAELLRYRDAALACLYRILFILYAEARDTRLDGHQLYKEGYSAQGLLDQVLDNISYSWPANRSSLWQRLRALFRIYDKGLPRISRWENIPPRGSDFFSSETPEGEILDQARLSDRIVARLMLDLATSSPRPGIGRERVSFRELDIENLGAVYEGLLEYEPKIARETTLEIQVQGRLFALTPDDVRRLCEQKDLSLRGDSALVADTACAEFHPDSAASEEEEAEDDQEPSEAGPDPEESDSEDDVEEDEEPTFERGATARIIRRLEPGMFHFVPGPSRKGSGSFYTPRLLVQDLIRHSLGPLVKGKSSAEIERLRILDPACGSAHFLVEAMRFLGQALHRAYVEEGKGRPPRDFRSTTGQGWDADWRASDEEARFSNSEARAWCKRRVAERCLFGVDLNPTAIQLARVALWIESAAGDRPLTYFEHHFRCGNSLLGTWLERLDRPPLPTLVGNVSSSGEGIRQLGIFQSLVRKATAEAAELRRMIDEVDPESLRREGKEPESVEEQEYKSRLRRRADEILRAVKLLFNLRSASAFIPEIWAEWDFLCDKIQTPEELRSYVEAQEWRPEFEKVAARERFFHWELEFPEVLLDEARSGFDAVLGNPPWDKILPNRHEFYARYDVLIRAFKGGELDQRIAELNRQNPSLPGEFVLYRDRINTIASILKKGGDYSFNEWEIDGRASGGHQDAFKYFVERAWRLAAEDGRVGFIVPSAIYNNEGCTGLRHLLLDETRIERFYGFENRKKIFPIDSRYKFVSLVFRKAKPEAESVGFEAAFMRHELEELDETALWSEPGKEGKSAFPGPIPWAVSVRRDELERLSPGTLAFLEYRSPRDRAILLKMYEGRPLLGDQGPGTWNARFYTEFNMTNDRDLWTDPKTNKLWTPRQILGAIPGTTDRSPYYEPAAWPEIRAHMAEAGFWPLYEGKHIEQFLIDIKPIERWVSLEAAEKKNGRLPDPGPKLVFRDIASNTNERTCIAAVLPERSCFGHTLSGIVAEGIAPETISAVLNSFPFDYCLRFRTAGMHLSFGFMTRLPIPGRIGQTKIEMIHGESGRICHIAEVRKAIPIIWLANRAIAEAYGLTPHDIEYMLSTFPIFARKRHEFYGYLLQQIGEWKAEFEGKRFPVREYLHAESQETLAAAETHKKYKAIKNKAHTRKQG
jgi:hypothetical protein